MKRILISTLLIVVITVSCATIAVASINDISIPDMIRSFFRYDFNSVEEIPDNSSDTEIAAAVSEYSMSFEPVNVSDGWLFELAGDGNLSVIIGTLKFDGGSLSERYIDIRGEYGEVRLLSNSFSAGSNYKKTLFWSFKQQEGASIIKGSAGDVKCVVLFEMADGLHCLYGYIDGDGTDFWSFELPQDGYYIKR